jgi:hypothetical protein
VDRICIKKAVFWDVAPFLHGAKSQKTAFFIVTAVKTSNLTEFVLTALGKQPFKGAENEMIILKRILG